MCEWLLKYVPYNSNFELSSKWILTKNPNLKRKKYGIERGCKGGGTVSKTVSQAVKRGKIQNSNHLNNVKHVVQSTFQNTE